LARDGLIVFADPCAEGRIDFVVCRDGARSWRADHAEFYLLDNWKDPAAKFARRFADAVDKLTTRTRTGPRRT
jgi:quinol monooxygenase YgiN